MPQIRSEVFQQNMPKEVTPEVISSALKLLTKVEQAVLLALHDCGSAVTTKHLRNYVIMDIGDYILQITAIMQKGELEGDPVLGKYNKIAIKALENAQRRLRQRPARNYLKLALAPYAVMPLVPKIQGIREKYLSETEGAVELNKLFSGANIEIPGFASFNRALEDLAANGYVFKREVPKPADKKVKQKVSVMWSIQPKIDLYLNKLFPEEQVRSKMPSREIKS